MQPILAWIIPWFSLAFLVFATFLAMGVNLLPALFGSRVGLALAGVVLVVGGVRAL